MSNTHEGNIITSKPYDKLLAIQVDVFQTQIIDERHFAITDRNGKLAFYKKYSIYDNVRIVEIPMRD